MALIDVADAVADQLGTISGLRAYKASKTPDSINDLPAVVVLIGPTLYNSAFAGEYDHTLRVMLLLSKADTPSAYKRLFDYISPAGSKSVPLKLETDPSFGGLCDTSLVGDNSGAGQTMWGGVPYLSSVWELQILM